MGGKPSNPRLYRREGAPALWLAMEGPRRTFAPDGGDVADLIGRTPAGVRTGACAWADGPRGKCLSFDGAAGTSVRVATVTPWRAPHFTLTCRVLRTSEGGIPGFITRTAGNNPDPFDWYYLGGSLRFFAQGPSSGLYTSVTLTVGRWYHLAATYDGATSCQYLDGVEIGSIPVSPLPASGSASAIRLGNRDDGVTGLTGLMDDARIYDQALSPAEIADEVADPNWWLRKPRREAIGSPAAGPPPTPVPRLDALLLQLLRRTA